MKIKPVQLFVILAAIAVFLLLQNQVINQSRLKAGESLARNNQEENADKIVELEITPNSTYGILMAEADIDPRISSAIFEAAENVYDLSNIRVGRFLNLYYDKRSGELVQLSYQIDSEEELYVTKVDRRATSGENLPTSSEEIIEEVWRAELREIQYEIKEKTVEGELQTSLYQWALDNKVDIRVIIELADAYQWTIDFAMDPRVGDTFKFIFQERYREGEYKMPGEILAAKYANAGNEYKIFYFEETPGEGGHYDENGTSVQKELLKAPINYKYITSGFTTGLRCLESFGLCTNHRAVDYAAAAGTPIRSVGEGTVVFAGWNGQGYGYLTSIRHNDTFTTNYAHQSKILVKKGQKVKQGEIIGKVGSTGLSTGPHLHYEIVKYGAKINPLTLDLPPGEPIKEENKARFFEEIGRYKL